VWTAAIQRVKSTFANVEDHWKSPSGISFVTPATNVNGVSDELVSGPDTPKQSAINRSGNASINSGPPSPQHSQPTLHPTLHPTPPTVSDLASELPIPTGRAGRWTDAVGRRSRLYGVRIVDSATLD
jgi:hypothetical protein